MLRGMKMNEPTPAKCYCGSISWGKEPESNRYTCVSCYRPLWMPMETAPKDRSFLAIINWDVGDKDDRQVEILEWDPEEMDWFTHNGGWLKKAGLHADGWMPLPELPK